MLFYNLPRFSVDLDFDLLNPEKKEEVLKRLNEILLEFGRIEAVEKRNTLLFLVNYQKGLRNLKVEISKRSTRKLYEIRHYLGISVLLMKKEDILAGKISAFLKRRKFAARDMFDLWFFLKNKWGINEEEVKEKTNLSLKKALKEAEKKASGINKNQLLSGLGDLLDLKKRIWVKDNLRDELLFYLKQYQEENKTTATGGFGKSLKGKRQTPKGKSRQKGKEEEKR